MLTTVRRPTLGSPPPEKIPDDLMWAYTRCGSIPISNFYIDDSRGGRGTHYSHSREDIEKRISSAKRELAHPNTFAAARGKLSWAHLLNAIKTKAVKDLIQGGRCVIFGSTQPSVESLLIAAGASLVVTVEYNLLKYDHPSIFTITPSTIEHAWKQKNFSLAPAPHSFDLALSISSFDHDGLGRYGDPLAPDGDLLAMDAMKSYLKPGGLALVTVPIGPDRVWWNLMRVYGKIRLPLLLHAWNVKERVGWLGGKELEDGAQPQHKSNGGHPGLSHEPVFILELLSSAAVDEKRGDL